MIFPWFSHDFPMIFPWFSHDPCLMTPECKSLPHPRTFLTTKVVQSDLSQAMMMQTSTLRSPVTNIMKRRNRWSLWSLYDICDIFMISMIYVYDIHDHIEVFSANSMISSHVACKRMQLGNSGTTSGDRMGCRAGATEAIQDLRGAPCSARQVILVVS